HINNSIKKAFYNLKLIYASRDLLNKSTIKLLCDSLVLSHFSYCDVVYHSCIDTHTASKIQRIQNCCVRLISGIRRWDNVSHKIEEINWLNMSNRSILHSSDVLHTVIGRAT